MTGWPDVCSPDTKAGEGKGAAQRQNVEEHKCKTYNHLHSRDDVCGARCVKCTGLQWGLREDSILPLLALSTCSNSSGNLNMASWLSSHLAARKCSSVVSWPMDFVSLSYKKKTRKKKRVSIKLQIRRWRLNILHRTVIDHFHSAGINVDGNASLTLMKHYINIIIKKLCARTAANQLM